MQYIKRMGGGFVREGDIETAVEEGGRKGGTVSDWRATI